MFIKKMTALCMAIMIVFSAGGCQRELPELVEEKITLKWVLSGPGKQADSDKVWKLFNEKLNEKMPGVQVEFEVIPINDYKDKWKLMVAAGEEIDIAWQGWVLDLEQEIRNGSYLPLNNLLDEHATGLKKSMPDWVWEGTTYDGNIYAVPNYQMMVTRPIALRTPKALADKYLDRERVEAAFRKCYEEGNVGLSDECFDVLEEYMQKLKDNGELGLGLTPEFGEWITASFGRKNNGIGYFEEENGKVVIKSMYDDSVPDTFYRRIADFYQKGFIRQDALTVQDLKKDIGTNGGYTLWIHNYDDYTAAEEELYYGYPIEVIELSFDECYVPNVVGATNTVIPVTSKNPQKAMQLLELVNSEEGKDLYNILVYGIEGEHYEKVGENRIRTFDYNGTPTRESRYGIKSYFIGNTFNAYESQVDVPGYRDYIKNVLHNNPKKTDIYGLKINTASMTGELAQIKSIEEEYRGLLMGTYPDYKSALDEMKTKMKAAGSEKVITELQRQIDEQLNNQAA